MRTMQRFFTAPCLGLEITSKVLRLSVLAGSGRNASLLASKSAQMPAGVVNESFASRNIRDQEGLTSLIQTALREDVPRSLRRAGLSLPDGVFRVQTLEFDELPPGAKDRERLIRWRLEKGAAFDTSNTILRYQVLPRQDKGFSVLACVAKQEVIEQYEELLTALGFEPWLVGPSSFNAVNFYASSIAQRGVRGYALVWITDTTSATVVWDRGGPRFYRSKEFRAGAPEEAAIRLQRELDDSLHFYMHMDRQQQTEVGHLFLDGDSAALAPLAQAMTEATNLTVEILSPAVVLSSAGADAAAMAAAFGAGGGG